MRIPNLSGSVGSRGANAPNDVKIVQKLLNEWRSDIGVRVPIDVNGLADRNTVIAIVEFQGRVVGMVEPDGRVDPGGRTLRLLASGPLRLKLLEDEGPGFYSYGTREKRHGTDTTLTSVRSAAATLNAMALEVGIGNISFAGGGKMPPHVSHQRGVDVDFRPLRKDGHRRGVTIHDAAYSRTDTARLVEVLRQDTNLEVIFFNDRALAGVRPEKGHDNHLHVRFKA